MNIYYTAKDIEDLAAKGVQQLEIGPGVTLTDFARESAQQLGITLVDSRKQQASPAAPPPTTGNTVVSNDRYNKPTGCMHASSPVPAASSQTAIPLDQSVTGGDSNTVNKLIDLMGKVIKRGE